MKRILVLLQDRWDDPIGDAAMESLTRWVEGGGKLLALHQGISLQTRPEFAAMLRARFAGHPDARARGLLVGRDA